MSIHTKKIYRLFILRLPIIIVSIIEGTIMENNTCFLLKQDKHFRRDGTIG
jgi:hypothetical protein